MNPNQFFTKEVKLQSKDDNKKNNNKNNQNIVNNDVEKVCGVKTSERLVGRSDGKVKKKNKRKLDANDDDAMAVKGVIRDEEKEDGNVLEDQKEKLEKEKDENKSGDDFVTDLIELENDWLNEELFVAIRLVSRFQEGPLSQPISIKVNFEGSDIFSVYESEFLSFYFYFYFYFSEYFISEFFNIFLQVWKRKTIST